MREIFAGLVKTQPPSSDRHGHCFNVGSITQLTLVPAAPFFIARPVEKPAPNKTGEILELCEKLIRQTKEQARHIENLEMKMRGIEKREKELEQRLMEAYSKMEKGDWVNLGDKGAAEKIARKAMEMREMLKPIENPNFNQDEDWRDNRDTFRVHQDNIRYSVQPNTLTIGNGDLGSGVVTITGGYNSRDGYTVSTDTVVRALEDVPVSNFRRLPGSQDEYTVTTDRAPTPSNMRSLTQTLGYMRENDRQMARHNANRANGLSTSDVARINARYNSYLESPEIEPPF